MFKLKPIEQKPYRFGYVENAVQSCHCHVCNVQTEEKEENHSNCCLLVFYSKAMPNIIYLNCSDDVGPNALASFVD